MAKKILIIDDEKPIRDSLAGILSDEGFVAGLRRIRRGWAEGAG